MARGAVIVPVRLIGGPFDGFAQNWETTRKLPEKLRMSLELATDRGGMRMEVSSPSACGALLSHERAADEVVYCQHDEGLYYYERLSDDFKGIPLGSA